MPAVNSTVWLSAEKTVRSPSASPRGALVATSVSFTEKIVVKVAPSLDPWISHTDGRRGGESLPEVTVKDVSWCGPAFSRAVTW